MKTKILFLSTIISLAWMLSSCETISLSARIKTVETVQLPFLKNSANECYHLDEFMPVPDSLVTGKSGILNLRYYTYAAAKYKNWDEQQIVLSFYSPDNRCWSLFEEYYIAN